MASLRFTILFVLINLVATGCRRTDPAVAEYSSAGRVDQGYTLFLYRSGKCRITANNGDGRFTSVGTYTTNKGGSIVLATRPQPTKTSLLMTLLGRWRSGPPSKQTLMPVQTNGLEYLVNDWRFMAYEKSLNSNLLHDQLKRLR